MSLESFTEAYIEAALWSSTYPADGDGNPVDPNATEDYQDTPIDDNYSSGDIAQDALDIIAKDCRAFYESNEVTWTESGMSDEQAGHDFWLTRNRHGAGFWDRGLGEAGDELTKAAKAWGSADLYIGDDGLVYHP